MPETYALRDVILKTLGYGSYADYLASDLWADIRRRAFEKHGHHCHGCFAAATEIHHFSYSRRVLTGTSLYQLIPLCHACHHLVEFGLGEEKRSLAQTQASVISLLTDAGSPLVKDLRLPPDDRQAWKEFQRGRVLVKPTGKAAYPAKPKPKGKRKKRRRR